jgi:hypothetical protein
MAIINRFLAALSFLLLAVGWWLLSIHQPVGRVLLIFGGIDLLLLLVRVVLKERVKDFDAINRFAGYLSFALVIAGLLFKLMQFEGGNVLLVLGAAGLLFQFLPLFFVLKYDRDKKTEAAQKAINELKLSLDELRTEKKISDEKEKVKPLDSISIPTMQGLVFVKMDDISHLEADDKYTKLFFAEKKMLLASRTLGDFEEILKNSGFVRIHHSYLINVKHLKNYIKGEGGQVIMGNGTALDVSRRKKQDLLAAVSQFR